MIYYYIEKQGRLRHVKAGCAVWRAARCVRTVCNTLGEVVAAVCAPSEADHALPAGLFDDSHFDTNCRKSATARGEPSTTQSSRSEERRVGKEGRSRWSPD